MADAMDDGAAGGPSEEPREPGAAAAQLASAPGPEAVAGGCREVGLTGGGGTAEPHDRPASEDEPDAKQRKLTGKDIFLRGGPKKELNTGQLFSGPDDLPLLRSRMDALESAWQLEHEASSRNLTYGLWPPGSSTVEVLLRRSKGWNAFGRMHGQRTLLHPEEALFLMESDRLLAFRAVGDHAPMSLHAGYAAAAAVGLTSERYAVFAHLCRLGFIVRHHSKASLRGEEDAADGPNAAQEPQLPTVEDLATGATAVAARGGRGPDGAAAVAGEAEQLEQGAHAPGSVLGGEHGTHAPVDGAASDAPCRGWWRPSAGWPQGQAAAPVLLDALPSEAQACADAWRPELLYDVWTTARMCGKKWASRPIFRVVMSTHRPPTAEEMVALARENGDVSLKCIVVKPGIVIGFDFGVVTSNTTPKQKGNR